MKHFKLFKFSIGEPVYDETILSYDENIPVPFKGIVKSKLIIFSKPNKASKKKFIEIGYLVDMEVSPHRFNTEWILQRYLIDKKTAYKYFSCCDLEIHK